MADETSTATNELQPNADVQNAGDPLTQMVADAKNKFGEAPSESEPSSTEPTAESDVTGQYESGTKQPDDKGAGTRMGQILANQRKALIRLGIDPDSDDLEKFNAGLIDINDIKTARTEPKPPENTLDSFDNFYSEIEQKRQASAPVTEDDFYKAMNFMKGVVQEARQVRQMQETSQVGQLVNECIGAIRGVIKTDEAHKRLPEDIQNIEEKFFIAAADSVWNDATGGDKRHFTPDAYRYCAEKLLGGDFERLRNTWIEYGKAQARPKPTPTNINPISSVEGGPPMSPPKKMIKMDDFDEAIKNYRSAQPII